ncbi:translation initiation factor 4E [Acrasis kona]|uniref:Translation initiation factor 4E n=1 Tax=Acrasis kona TaxID=1008807 RepID=A0AAW2ZND9_9EUKA
MTEIQEDEYGSSHVVETNEGSADEAIDYNSVHALERNWSLWFDNPSGRNRSCVKLVYTFDTVESFWSVYDNIKKPSSLSKGTNYRLFKEGIEPKWEDPQNAIGGALQFTVKGNIDDQWLDLQLATIGENFTHIDAICGINVSLRKAGNRVEIWTKNSKDEDVTRSIAQEMKQVLDIGIDETISFKSHKEELGINYKI